MLTYQEALKSIDREERPSLLLGNGFSQAWNKETFNYANLLEKANFGPRDAIIKSLFANLNTYDFEVIMRQLVSTEIVCEAYGVEQGMVNQIKEDKKSLKKSLITVISSTHPFLPSNVTDDQYISVRKFISGFNQIFTVNYDLLLYWSINKNNLEPKNYKTDDGFRASQLWKGYDTDDTDQKVHFLHGGLHIYDSGIDIKKHVCKDTGKTIIEQVRENLEAGKFPLFVSEPNHEDKLKKIEHNPYLNYCFQALRKLQDTLFIYGHSMDENDKHIFSQIKSSQTRKVFVSIYGDENSEANTRTKANAQAFLQEKDRNVDFFNAASVPIWA